MIIYYLTFDDVIELYATHIGRKEGLLRPDLLASAVALPQATMFGEDLYPDIFAKAAAMLRSIAQNQAFVDGNKRIAWIAMRVFLAANGFDVTARVDDGLDLMIRLAENKVDLEGIAAFLAERSTLRPDFETGDEASGI